MQDNVKIFRGGGFQDRTHSNAGVNRLPFAHLNSNREDMKQELHYMMQNSKLNEQ